MRHSVNSARSIIERLYPVKSQREIVLRILAHAIDRANRVGPASWEVTLTKHRIRLNVGNGAVFQLYPNRMILIVTGELMRLIPHEKREAFKHNARYRFGPDAYEGVLPVDSLATYHCSECGHY
jgi:hypothetical protein